MPYIHFAFPLLILAAAADTPPSPPPPPIDCGNSNHKALDFWLGDWSVSDTASGVVIATSRVEKIAKGCALRETYEQTVGPDNLATSYAGTSYSAFNNADRTWRQLYVDTAGAALSYSGTADGKNAVLEAYARKLGTRMTMRARPDGSVRQTGEITRDGGKTWAPGHDFSYRRR